MVKTATSLLHVRKGGIEPVEMTGEEMFEFMLRSGMLFDLNLRYFHVMGFALLAKTDNRGNQQWALLDSTANPTIVFDRESYLIGMAKWRPWYNQYGGPALTLRHRKLGFTHQSMPR